MTNNGDMFEGYFLDRLPHGKVVYVKNLAANKDEPMEEKDEVWGNYSRVLFPSHSRVLISYLVAIMFKSMPTGGLNHTIFLTPTGSI